MSKNLFEMVRGNDVDSVEKYKGNVNIKDIDGNTPLHIAAKLGYLRMIELLVSKKANKEAMNEADLTPIQVAKNRQSAALIDTGDVYEGYECMVKTRVATLANTQHILAQTN